ncbi:MAG: lipoyl(octanoyl) transferase LipB [Bacteroidota bacterium]|nr:lipoyl(octanoyl) transferase LipB [Bacteroidota bacterium]
MQQVKLIDAGHIPYMKAWEWQTLLFNELMEKKIAQRDLPKDQQLAPDHYLILCTHPPVYTLGKSGKMENLLLSPDELDAKDIEFYRNNRGGDITYHGPGQIVGYPILDLDWFFTDIHKYMRLLEDIHIRICADYGIVAGRYPKFTGTWIDVDNDKARKICAQGVKCSRWITMHGWAFNVNTDLSYFNHIIPCGIDDKAVTSLQKEAGYLFDFEEVKEKSIHYFAEIFECEIVR